LELSANLGVVLVKGTARDRQAEQYSLPIARFRVG